MYHEKRPLILIHGLWNNSRIFNKLYNSLIEKSDIPLFIPNLPHRLGSVPLIKLANDLDKYILSELAKYKTIDLLGFSMGGLIGRIWLQKLGGFLRTKNFITVGTPHMGTLTAQFVPNCLFSGIADMKRKSYLINQLNNDITKLKMVYCKSFYCRSDLMVFPGWEAIMPLGYKQSLPVFAHRELVTSQIAIDILVKEILNLN